MDKIFTKVQKAQYARLLRQEQTPRIKEQLRLMKAHQEKVKSQLKVLSYWACPILNTNTEQSSSVSLLLRMPSNAHPITWLGLSVQELEAPLLLEKESLPSHTLYRFSIGGGYRSLYDDLWGWGIYGYYDFIPNKTPISRRYYSFGWNSPVHTMSGGVEFFHPLGRMTGNFYVHHTRPMQAFVGGYPAWGGDIKISIHWRKLTLAGGGYYQNLLLKDNHLVQPHNIFGTMIEVYYTYGSRSYGIKYSYDDSNQHRVSLNLQWRPSQPYQVQDSSRLWASVERYIGPFCLNAKGLHRLEHKTRQLRNVLSQQFIEKYQDQTPSFQLSQEEKQLLAPFGDLPILSTQTTLTSAVIPRAWERRTAFNKLLFSYNDDVFSKGHMPLAEKLTVQSLINNVLWLDTVSRCNESTIAIFEQLATWYNLRPSRQEINIIKEFLANSKFYLSHKQYAVLQMNQDTFFLPRQDDYSLGSRVRLLGDIAKIGCKEYKTSLANSNNKFIDIRALQTLAGKLQKEIISDLRLEYAALRLMNLPQQGRDYLLAFSYGNPIKRENTKQSAAIQSLVQGLQSLPYEIREIIFEEIFDSYQDDRWIASQAQNKTPEWIERRSSDNRRRLRREDYWLQALYYNSALTGLPVIPSEDTYKKKLSRFSTSILYRYVSEIKTEQDYQNYLKMSLIRVNGISREW